jgi:UDP-N-acetylmuramyl pentapeptide phosphotransferase/UDP-N-acetylglucosamine-1-phosphate transferase
MMDALLVLIPFALAGLISPFAVWYCRAKGLVAAVDARRSHTKPTPHGGGIVLVMLGVPMLLGVIWGGEAMGYDIPFRAYLTMMVLMSIPVAYVGWLADKHEKMAPSTRLWVHLAAVAGGLMFLPQLFDFMPLPLEKLGLLLAWGWFVNLFNFMDGADGLSSTEATCIGLGVALLAPQLLPLAAIIMGLCVGFLRVNWHPAKLFMGDVGSTWLGFVLGGLLMVAMVDDTIRLLFPLATVTLVFCADATWTLVRRMSHGHKPSEPHKTFWFHRFLGLGWKHHTLALGVAGVNAVLLAIALAGAHLMWGVWTLAMGFGVMLLVFGYISWFEKRAGIRVFD